MPTSDEGRVVSIGLGGGKLTLCATGPADAAYPGGAYPAQLRLEAGDLQLNRRCHVYAVPAFCDRIAAIHGSLQGRAALATLDDIDVALEGDGAGHIMVTVEAGDVAETNYRVRARFVVDQTFLPPFISGLKSAFPDVSR